MKAMTENDTRYKRLEHEIYDKCCKLFVIVTASILTDKLGMSGAKTEQVLQALMERADSIVKGYASLDDFNDVLKEEYNIIIT